MRYTSIRYNIAQFQHMHDLGFDSYLTLIMFLISYKKWVQREKNIGFRHGYISLKGALLSLWRTTLPHSKCEKPTK